MDSRLLAILALAAVPLVLPPSAAAIKFDNTRITYRDKSTYHSVIASAVQMWNAAGTRDRGRGATRAGAERKERPLPPAFRYEGPAARARSTARAAPCVHGGPWPHSSVSARVAASPSRDASAPALSAVAAPATI